MAIKIGTGFMLNSPKHLDKRMDMAETTEDLKNWNINVPELFEVMVEGKKYYYSSTLETEKTGHWIPLLVDDLDNIIDPEHQLVSAGLLKKLLNNK